MKKSTTVIVTVLVTLAIIVLGLLVWMYSGVFNISTQDDDWAVKTWFFETVKTESIDNHAGEVETPELTDQMVTQGANSYEQMCAHCHGAPGVEAHEWAKHMHPEPPALSEEAGEYAPAEIFWITKHGIEMSGMPAWDFESDEHLWKVVAFVEQLPGMTKGEYRALVQSGSGHGGHDHAH